MPDIQGKSRQSKSSVAKRNRKKMVSRGTSTHICNKATAKVFEKY